ncbi:MAG: TRAP transporter TatT component family protein [Sedimenticola sp.]|nr:TRAP transporter TatT component family protein [Sedimenticola sp.]
MLLSLVFCVGCVSLARERLADNLASAMLNQDDPETVRAGAPAYLLLIDGMIREEPDDPGLLMAASRLYGAVANGLVSDPERARRLTARAREYARRAFCPAHHDICNPQQDNYQSFVNAVERSDPGKLEPLYIYATSWAGWIAARGNDWSALADLPKVEYLLQYIVDREPGYHNGRAQLYLAMMRSQLPPALGGKPETGRHHFEQAIAHSRGRDLIAKVEYARRYARLVYDQALHDRLLGEVLQAPAEAPDLTLSNILAKQQARRLLEDGYF